MPTYELDEVVATRQAYAEALVALGGSSNPELVVLDGEVSNSTRTSLFEAAFPERFFEMYIAEQQMLAAAVGMQARGWLPVAATFSAFLTRAHDFVRMAAVSRARLAIVGTHAGVSIGQDGPSQMGLEDIAMFRSIPDSTVLYPSDAQQAASLMAAMLRLRGISYLRATREGTPVIYSPGEEFPVGGSRTLRSSASDELTVFAAGVTVHEALRAADLLSGEIAMRVVDLYSVKPVDVETVRRAARETTGILTVEDHRPEGGLGDAVLEALAEADVRVPVRKLAVHGMPGSATPAEQRALARIDASAIAAAARELMQR
jgi:transketolase